MRRGVGLVEAALAALVLATALAILFQALGLSVRGTEQVAEEMIATQLASDLIDGLSGVPFGELPEAREGPPGAVAFADPARAAAWKRALARLAIPPAYTATVAIEPAPGPLKRILVRVSWGGRAVKLARLRTDEVGL